MAEEYTVSDSKTGKPEHYQDQDVIETALIRMAGTSTIGSQGILKMHVRK